MRRIAVGIVVVGACALVGAPSASAFLTWPQQFGDPCAATTVAPGQTALAITNNMSGAALSVQAPPEATAVITKWKVNAPGDIGPIPEQLVAFHQVGAEEDQLVGESSLETVVSGAANEFATRLPIPEGGQIGLRGPDGALICSEPAHLAGLVAEPWAVGESRHFKIEVSMGVPVVATLEPDRDHDGYGDETQDKCPSQPAIHTACPFVVLRPVAKAFRRGILVEVSTGDPTQVEVTGQVGWGYRPPSGGPNKRLIVGLLAGGPQEVGTGATVGFWLPLPKSVIGRLGKLTNKEKLNAHLSVVATDVVGHQTTRKMGVRLPGYLMRRPAN
jgi:hypothetical protein